MKKTHELLSRLFEQGASLKDRYSEQLTVKRYETGVDNTARVQSICNYLEEVAGNHAASLGYGMEHLAESELAWVLVKMRLLLHRLPVAGETINIMTWPVGVDRLIFQREFLLFDTDIKPLVEATTQFVVINRSTRKLERILEHDIANMPFVPDPVFQESDIRIPLVEGGVQGPEFPVRLADIDQNYHVNNVRYVDFALEAAEQCFEVTPSLESPFFLRQMEVMFRSEGLRGDCISVVNSVESQLTKTYLHSLRRKATGQELARIRTVWA